MLIICRHIRHREGFDHFGGEVGERIGDSVCALAGQVDVCVREYLRVLI